MNIEHVRVIGRLGRALVLAGLAACSPTPGDAPAAASVENTAPVQTMPAADRPAADGGGAPAPAANGGSVSKPTTPAAQRQSSAGAAAVGGAGVATPAMPNVSSPVGGMQASAAGTGGAEAGAIAEAGSPAAATREDLGMGAGSDVVCLGDSWMAGIAPALIRVSGQSYRNYSRGGAPLLQETAGTSAGARRTIPQQLDAAKMEDADIKTIVLTAGGIDLSEGAGRGSEEFEPIKNGLIDLFQLMADNGIEDVVYFSYSRASSEQVQENFIAMQTKVCDAAPVRCHFIDSDTIINRMLADGIHPTSQGSMDLATAAHELMVSEGLRR